MTTYLHYSPTTVHVLRDGKRIGSLYRGATGAWFFERHAERVFVSHERLSGIVDACLDLHGHFATPERVEALNRKL